MGVQKSQIVRRFIKRQLVKMPLTTMGEKRQFLFALLENVCFNLFSK
jgi:hypothetical protein